jgi:hypothetical protein
LATKIDGAIRERGNNLRICVRGDNPGDVLYLSIEPKICWSATFTAWGRETEVPIVSVAGKKFRIVLEPL